MEFIIIFGAFLLALAGLAGAIIPGLPGPPLSFLSLIVFNFSKYIDYSTHFLVIMAVIAIVITVLDFYIPIYGTKRFGGTKAGSRGALIGLIAGVFVLPFLGIVLGPFGLIGIIGGPVLGAYLGETMAGTSTGFALRSAIGSFIGFVAGTLMKLVYSFLVFFYLIKDSILALF
ncbi:MAG: DUF456 domain-containing protein [Bacteroidales bacterium]|nr:DUF456 domain-containing protein [Bacteroidales bacterium]